MEKDELLCQVLGLQKEVSCLSSSTLTKEKESLRKELEKTKLKLKDTESKLKNAIKDKIKLEVFLASVILSTPFPIMCLQLTCLCCPTKKKYLSTE